MINYPTFPLNEKVSRSNLYHELTYPSVPYRDNLYGSGEIFVLRWRDRYKYSLGKETVGETWQYKCDFKYPSYKNPLRRAIPLALLYTLHRSRV